MTQDRIASAAMTGFVMMGISMLLGMFTSVACALLIDTSWTVRSPINKWVVLTNMLLWFMFFLYMGHRRMDSGKLKGVLND